MAEEKAIRNPLIFDAWWRGASQAELANSFGVSYQTINNVLNREIWHRRLAYRSIVKKLRNELGKITPPPKDKAELREAVLIAYGLKDREDFK